jgi:hypothetical protein
MSAIDISETGSCLSAVGPSPVVLRWPVPDVCYRRNLPFDAPLDERSKSQDEPATPDHTRPFSKATADV